MKNRMAVIALLGLCLTGAADPKLVPFESKEGRFRIGLPEKPEFSTKQINREEGEQVVLRIFSVTRRDGIYSVIYQDEPDEDIRDRNAEWILRQVRDGLVGAVRGTLISDQPLSLAVAGAFGREFVASAVQKEGNRKFHQRSRIMMVGRRLYQLQVIGGEAMVNSKESTAVLDSFVFDPPPAGEACALPDDPDKSMRLFKPEGARFSIQMPGKPIDWVAKREQMGREVSPGLKLFGVEHPDREYGVLYLDIPPEARFGSAEAVLNIVQGAFLKVFKGTLIDQRSTRAKGVFTREFTCSIHRSAGSRPYYSRMRLVLTNSRLFSAFMVGVEGKTETVEADKFFASFDVQTLEAAKAEMAKAKRDAIKAAASGTSKKVASTAGPAAKPKPSGVLPPGPAPSWRPFNYNGIEGIFHSTMPGKPDTGEGRTVLGARKATTFSCRAARLTYAIQVQAVPTRATSRGAKPVLDASRDMRLLSALGGKVSGERAISTLDDSTGREYRVKDGTEVVRVRSFLSGDSLYDVSVTGPEADVTDADAEKFFRSFRIGQ